MASDFIQPNNPELDKLVAEATSGEDIGSAFQAMKDALHQAGSSAQPAPDASMPATTEWEYSEEIRWADSLNRRPLILRAHTAEDLERLKSQILYGK
jgi:hypothetical protein